MMIGPAPMIKMLLMSLLFGMCLSCCLFFVGGARGRCSYGFSKIRFLHRLSGQAGIGQLQAKPNKHRAHRPRQAS